MGWATANAGLGRHQSLPGSQEGKVTCRCLSESFTSLDMQLSGAPKGWSQDSTELRSLKEKVSFESLYLFHPRPQCYFIYLGF